MASTTKLLSNSSRAAQALAAPPARRTSRWGWLQLLRETFGGALLLATWLALWTVTWAAVAGPLSPAHDSGAARAQVAEIERT